MKEDTKYAIGFSIFLGLLVFFGGGWIFGIAQSMNHYSNGTVLSYNNSWKSDGFTYSNFTVYISNNQIPITVKCNYFSVGSFMHFNNEYFWTLQLGVSQIPILPEGC